MKIDKETEKALVKLIKSNAGKNGFKTISTAVYRIADPVIYDSYFITRARTTFAYRVEIKKLSYDNLFWNIMDMADNAKASTSLRVNGAFVSPFVTLKAAELELSDDIHAISNKYWEIILSTIESSKKIAEDVNAYVLNEMGVHAYREVMLSLAYLDSGEVEKAKDIATEFLGDSGYVNGRKDFFERLLEKYS